MGEKDEQVRADLVTAALFDLDEPWRERFLGLVANLATCWAWEEKQPTREEIEAWLGARPILRKQVWSLLLRWRRPTGGDT